MTFAFLPMAFKLATFIGVDFCALAVPLVIFVLSDVHGTTFILACTPSVSFIRIPLTSIGSSLSTRLVSRYRFAVILLVPFDKIEISIAHPCVHISRIAYWTGEIQRVNTTWVPCVPILARNQVLSAGYLLVTKATRVWAVIVHWVQQGVSLPLLNLSLTLQCGRALSGPEVWQQWSSRARLCRRQSLFPYHSSTMHGLNSYTLSLHLAFLIETEEQTSHTYVTLLRMDIAEPHVVHMTGFLYECQSHNAV